MGISSRTNEAGARALAAAFPEYVVSPVVVRGPHQVGERAASGWFKLDCNRLVIGPHQVGDWAASGWYKLDCNMLVS